MFIARRELTWVVCEEDGRKHYQIYFEPQFYNTHGLCYMSIVTLKNLSVVLSSITSLQRIPSPLVTAEENGTAQRNVHDTRADSPPEDTESLLMLNLSHDVPYADATAVALASSQHDPRFDHV